MRPEIVPAEPPPRQPIRDGSIRPAGHVRIAKDDILVSNCERKRYSKNDPDFSLEEEKVVSLLVRSPSDRFLDGLFMLDGRMCRDCPVISDRTLPMSTLKTNGSPVNGESATI